LRERIRETTIDAILAAAEEVFADAGLHGARMDTIAAKAGVSVGTLYNHFEDREALVAGLLTARRRELVGQIDAALQTGAHAPLRTRLRAILDAFSAHCEAHRKFVNIALQHELGSHHRSFAQARAKKLDTMREIQSRIEEQMKRGVKEGALRPELGELAGTFFLGMLRALILRDLTVEAGAGTMAADVERLLDTFFAGAGTGAARRSP